ncbi:unnamed protein product [Pedinophyceae sp. YPF-701]|nr:unnamed protein product [Pedinophyceae sp. YPF-701]
MLPSNSAIQTDRLILRFKDPNVEDQYLAEVASRRWPVLMLIMIFDTSSFVFRFISKATKPGSSVRDLLESFMQQLTNMTLLYMFLGMIYLWARRHKGRVSRQEELVLSSIMALAITCLLLNMSNSQDYVLFAFFLICITTFMQIRWWVGSLCLLGPTALAVHWIGTGRLFQKDGRNVRDHIIMAFMVGALMSYLAETYRRQMFANHKLAAHLAAKELMQARARILAQRQLTLAQQEAASRQVTIEREQAANEAKSEFMSLMCHEVRTPLNGCLASAEMLLESALGEEQFELANTIRVSGSILLSTVSNFLDFFKMEAGKQLDIVRREVDLHELVNDVHLIIDAMIDREGSVKLLKPDTLGLPPVMSDPDRLRGILLNLMTNAVKFTKQGHIFVRVRVVRQGQFPIPEDAVDERSEEDEEPEQAEMAMRHSYICKIPQDEENNGMRGRESITLPSRRHKQGSFMKRPSMQVVREMRGQKSMDNNRLPSNAPGGAARRGALTRVSEGSEKESFAAAGNSGRGPSRTPSGRATVARHTGNASVGTPHSNSHHRLSTRSVLDAADEQASAHSADACANSATGSATPAANGTANTSTTEAGEPDRNSKGSSRRAYAMSVPRDSEDSTYWLIFEVEDTGRGIAPGGLRNLFKDFVQGSEAEMQRPRETGGTGLGLSICSKQVNFLGGRIGAHSKLGAGSTFWFNVPLSLPSSQRDKWTFKRYLGERAAALPSGRKSIDRSEREVFTPITTRASLRAAQQYSRRSIDGIKRRSQDVSGSLSDAPGSLAGGLIPLPTLAPHVLSPTGRASIQRRSLDRYSIEQARMVINNTAGRGFDPGAMQIAHTSSLYGMSASRATALPDTGKLAPPPAVAAAQEAQRAAVATQAAFDAWKQCAPSPRSRDDRASEEARESNLPPLSRVSESAEENAEQLESICEAISGLPQQLRSEVFSHLGQQLKCLPVPLLRRHRSESLSKIMLQQPGHALAGIGEEEAAERQGSESGSWSRPGAGKGSVFNAEAHGDAAQSARVARFGEGADSSEHSHKGKGSKSESLDLRAPSLTFPSVERVDSVENIDKYAQELRAGQPERERSAPAVPPSPFKPAAPSASVPASPSAAAPIAFRRTTGGGGSGNHWGAHGSSHREARPSTSGHGNPSSRPRNSSGTLLSLDRDPSFISVDVSNHSRNSVGSESDLKGLKVLLVEDNHINQKVACKLIKQMGIDCDVVQNGQEAVDRLSDGAGGGYDVVLMDMLMPVMGGLRATEVLREKGIKLPVLAMTANASDKDRDACRGVGMDGFVSKPVLKSSLSKALLGVIHNQGWVE